MNNRDTLITEKISELEKRKAEILSQLSDEPAYTTNLMVNGFSCRTVTSKDQLIKPFGEISEAHRKIQMFEAVFGGKVNDKIFGYTWEEWIEDFKTLIIKIELNAKLAAVNEAIKKLDRFYSEDKKTTDSFNSLLQDIENI